LQSIFLWVSSQDCGAMVVYMTPLISVGILITCFIVLNLCTLSFRIKYIRNTFSK